MEVVMDNRNRRKLLSLLIAFSLVFTLGFSTYAADSAAQGAEPQAAYEPAEAPLADSAAEPEDPVFLDEPPAPLQNPLGIKSVEVLNGGATQSLYRPDVYAGKAENGEDPAKYYTNRRSFSFTDPRVFSLEFTVAAADVPKAGALPTEAELDAYLAAINFNYGGVPLSSWGNGQNLRGTTPIFTVSGKSIAPIQPESGQVTAYKVSATLRTSAPFGSAANAANAGSNVPYAGYYGYSQGTFSNGQSVADFNYLISGPTGQGQGVYPLEAVAGEATLASVDVRVGLYDDYRDWNDINAFAQSLIFALTGSNLNLAEKKQGVIASGTLVKDAYGNYVAGDGVFIEVSITGYSHRGNPVWSIAAAKEGKTIDDYLKPGGFKDQMNNNPKALMDKYKDAEPEEIDFVLPFYMNNVHPDEVSGTDTMMRVIDDLIEGGKSGKDVAYKTYENDDISWNYRPSGNTNTGYSAYNHYVKGGYTGLFAQADSRKNVTIGTDEILDKFIVVASLCSNPDGKELMRRTNKFNLDLNRDAVFMTQPEAIALVSDIAKWDPIVMIEWHGYVTQLLIEPCTAPHCPNYEDDLLLNNMIQLAYYGGKAAVGSSGYNRFHLPWDSMASGWDDGGNVYGPMLAMLLGCMGWTIELPHANQDSFDAGNALAYAFMNALLNGETAYYEGNVLNRGLPGEDDNSVDNKYASMRKSSVMNKLETKYRGVENIDAKETIDKYFINVVNGVKQAAGRARKTDAAGNELPFFPDYLLVPSSPDVQWNVAEAMRTLAMTQRLGAKVKRTTEAVTYNGVTYPAGTYLYDMKQGQRNLVAEIMSKGYDASQFASMYADIYCNYPDLRGFDCYEVWSPGLFDGKATDVTENLVKPPSNITGAESDYILFKSNSTDAVRFVNLLLSGKSSGPSVSDGTASVWMLRKSVEGVGNMSDYIIQTSDYYKINFLTDNPDLGLQGCHLEGKYVSALPEEAVALVNPVIQLNTTRNKGYDGGAIYWALDDFLGFSSMKDADGTEYTGTGTSSIRAGANVFILNGAAGTTQIRDYVRQTKAGVITLNNAIGLLTQFGYQAPATVAIGDAAFYGDYNVNDSLYTANYAGTHTLYGRGLAFNTSLNGGTGNVIPAGSKELFRTYAGTQKDWFIGGYQRTKETGTNFANRTTMFSTLLKQGITGKPAQHVTFGSNMFYRPHYQKYYPMLATAIFAGAAGILDDQLDPTLDSFSAAFSADGFNVEMTASDADSGVGQYAVYLWNPGSQAYELLADEQADGAFNIAGLSKTVDYWFRAEVSDYAGNKLIQDFAYLNGQTVLLEEGAAPAAKASYRLGGDGRTVGFDLYNPGAAAKSFFCIAALYDAKGRLIQTVAKDVSLSAASGQQAVQITLADDAEGTTLKAYVWGSNYAPHAKAAEWAYQPTLF
jgi:hypothetical protein